MTLIKKTMITNNGAQQAYNPQIAVDGTKGIIVGAVLTNSPVDTNELISTLEHVNKTTGEFPRCLTVDAGYFSTKNIKYCNEQKIDAYIAATREGKKPGNSFDKTNFIYDLIKDIYICPENKKLIYKNKSISNKKRCFVYQCEDCLSCPKQSECVRSRYGKRVVKRTLEDPILEVMRNKLATESGKEIFRKRNIQLSLSGDTLRLFKNSSNLVCVV